MHQTHPSTACGTTPPGKTTRGQGSKSKSPQSKRTTKKAAAAPAPAQELVKASRQASNNRGKRQGALKQAGGERVREAGRTGQGGGEAGRMEQEGGEARGTGDRGGWGLGAGGGGCTREAETSATDSSSAGHARTRTQQGAAQSARTDSMGAARPPAGRAGRPPPPAHQLPEHGAPPGSAIERHRGVSKTIGMQSARRDGGNQQGRRGLSQRARGQRQGQGAAAPEGRRCPRRRRAAGGHPA